MIKKLGIRFKLTLFFVVVFGVLLSFYSFYLYHSMAAAYQQEFDVFLYNYAVEFGNAIDFNIFGDVTLDRNLLNEEKKLPFSLGEMLVQIRTIDGQTVRKSRRMGDQQFALTLEDFKFLRQKRYVIKSWRPEQPINNNDRYRVISYLVTRDVFTQLILQVAVPDYLVIVKSKRILNIFLFAVPLILLISAVLGYYFSYFALEPVKRIINTARAINVYRLDERVPVPSSADELSDLAVTLNNLLDRLEKSFRGQEQFIADASHQLKTPLTILKNEIDQLAKDHTFTEVFSEKIFSLKEELEYLIHLVNDLLVLAKVAATGVACFTGVVRVDEILIAAIGKMKPLADNDNIALLINFVETDNLDPEKDFLIKGDYDLLKSLFQSLIENSIKYSPSGSKIVVSLELVPSKICVHIVDAGPGIAAEDMDRVFDRFYRGRNIKNQVHGSGLGLAIAKKIADLHSASIKLNNLAGGGLDVAVLIDQNHNADFVGSS